ncbi:MAG: aminotransferase class III-fold pyridoxal phosphate-dependent enzyme [Gemmatimonadales bacterium]|nr:aminotransferase class III-fold pyridoxal phosphate-dependent enzyme [Gemmatimonadales bacterium]
MDRGEGCRLVDVDGNRLLDFTGNHSSLVHGYGHPHVIEAVRRQLDRGTAFPGPTEPQIRLARMLSERIPSMELVRFTNSGTEAVMNAVRGARAFTGRRAIACVEGSYHGTLEETMAGAHPDAVVLPFDDTQAAVRLIERERGRLAAVLVEPVQGSAGMLPAEQGYLRALREVTQLHGIMLVFDEVVSLRVAFGGAQQHYGVRPDLTCLGKLIGGGFPLGAFGGRADLMELFDPSHGRPQVPHPGSLNANPISLAAGAATLELLTADAIGTLNRRGASVRDGILAEFTAAKLPAQVTGLGSLFGVHLTDKPVRTIRDSSRGDAARRHRLFLALYCAGILIDPRGVGTLSTVLNEADIDHFLDVLGKSVLGVAGS